MPDSQPDVSELAREVVAELEDTRQIGDQVLLSRREAIALSTGAVSLGALGVAAAGTASAQEAAGQIGTEAEPVNVEGAQGNFSQGVSVDGPLEADTADVTGTTTTEALEAGGLVVDETYYWASQFDGSDADERLKNALSEVGKGSTIYLENATYTDDFELNTRGISLVGPTSEFIDGGADFDDATLTFNDRGSVFKIFRIDTLTANSERVRVQNSSFGSSDDIVFSDDECAFLGNLGGVVTFDSETEGGIVDGCRVSSITDNGNNTIGDIS